MLAVVAALLVFISVKAMQPSVPVVVAQRNLSVGATIAPEDVAVKSYPAAAVSGSTARKKEQVIGKTITFGPVLAGEAVRTEHLTEAGSLLTTLKTFAPEGWSAVELPLDTSLGMQGLRRGDKVDIYGEVPYGEGTQVNIITEAIVLSAPDTDGKNKSKQYIVAVPANFAPGVAETVVRGEKVTVVLPSSQLGEETPTSKR